MKGWRWRGVNQGQGWRVHASRTWLAAAPHSPRLTSPHRAHLDSNSIHPDTTPCHPPQIYLGGFDREEQAALAYDLAAVKCRGLDAATNYGLDRYALELRHMEGESLGVARGPRAVAACGMQAAVHSRSARTVTQRK